jgi:hypothetical protein
VRAGRLGGADRRVLDKSVKMPTLVHLFDIGYTCTCSPLLPKKREKWDWAIRVWGGVVVFLQVGVTLISWFALMFVSTNLTGLLFRGLFTNAELEEIVSDNEILARHHRNSERKTNIIAAMLIFAFLSIIYYFWNAGLVIAVAMLMISRIPDLIWEIKSGKKLELADMKRPKLSLLTTAISWASLPVVWYSIYRM